MVRELSKSTVNKFEKLLAEERERIVTLLEVHEREREEAHRSETSSERTPDPTTAEGGTMAFEYQKELAVDSNLEDIVRKIDHAQERIGSGTYGICESCGNAIPVARLGVLLHASQCVECASKR
jgi:DnaK suppressor protein